MQSTSLAQQLAVRISDQIRTEKAPKGMRLVERKLAEQLRVSRSPVRSALRLLEAEGVVGAAEGGGFVVLDAVSTELTAPSSTDDDLYHRMADDRLNGELADKMTENALMRRYDVTRAQLAGVLRRIVGEGWIERLPGHGWAFLPMLTSMQAYEDSYRFRLTIEPAAILEPGFVLDLSGLEERRREQRRLFDGAIWTESRAGLFDANSRLHETIIACSRNSFFIEGLRRIDKLRRLIEYRQTLDREHAIVRCGEHLDLIDLLLQERREEASAFLRRHLASVSVQKTADPNATGQVGAATREK